MGHKLGLVVQDCYLGPEEERHEGKKSKGILHYIKDSKPAGAV